MIEVKDHHVLNNNNRIVDVLLQQCGTHVACQTRRYIFCYTSTIQLYYAVFWAREEEKIRTLAIKTAG